MKASDGIVMFPKSKKTEILVKKHLKVIGRLPCLPSGLGERPGRRPILFQSSKDVSRGYISKVKLLTTFYKD